MTEPRKTIPEQLDAAKTSEEFALVIMDMFAAMDRARQEEENDD